MNYIKLSPTDGSLINELSRLASAIVKEHYDPIIGAEQNDYMIERFQSPASIAEQLSRGISYYLVCTDDGGKVGFIAFYPRGTELYLSKFYLHKAQRGQGISKQMMSFVLSKARKTGASSVTLNVNKHNDLAIAVYEKLNFHRIRDEKIDIGGGWFMDDYVYEYTL